MNKLITLLTVLSFWAFQASAQSYTINTYHNQTISTCSGTLYDSGGPTGNYQPNESYTVTICPSTAGAAVQLSFNAWNIGAGESLEIFDGNNTSANSYGTFNNTMSPVGMIIGASVLNTTGCITLVWTSTGSDGGFEADINCGMPCQYFSATLQTSTPPFSIDSGIYYIDICPGDTISITGTGDYTNNNQVYHQSDLTSVFAWDFGNGVVDTNQTVEIYYDTISGFNIELTMFDSLGCMSTSFPEIRVRVSTKPSFDGTHPVDPAICQYDTTTLMGVTATQKWKASSQLNHAGLTYLPDGSGASYTSTLVFNSFGQGQQMTSANDIEKICADLEHSYLGDLHITISCPNGQQSVLKSFPGGTSTYLGEPIDNNANQVAGLGYEYCWKTGGTTTMLAAAGTYTHDFTDVNGTAYTGASFLPPSTSYPASSTAGPPFPIVEYQPETSFNNLIGCPLNGAWTITVTDNLNIDNGFIFSWGIEFNQSVLPVSWGYKPWVVDSTWSNPGNLVGFDKVVGTNPGNYNYTYTITDNLGCDYDTTLEVHVTPKPVVDLIPDTTLCDGDFVVLDAGNSLPGQTYLWNIGAPSQTVTVYIPDMWSVTVSYDDSVLTCSSSDSVLIEVYGKPTVNLGQDTCVIGSHMLDAQNAGATPPFQYIWNTGATSQTLSVASSGEYIVSVAQNFSSNCVASDTIIVTTLPPGFLGTDMDFCMFDDKIFTIPGDISLLNYAWVVNGTNASSSSVFDMGTYAPGSYTLSFEGQGCEQTVNVEIKACEIEDPYNIITPNGDHANQKFIFDGLDDFPESTIRIYNRWGKKVYEASPYNNDWDGENHPDGVYFYTLNFGKGDYQKELHGTVTVIRE